MSTNIMALPHKQKNILPFLVILLLHCIHGTSFILPLGKILHANPSTVHRKSFLCSLPDSSSDIRETRRGIGHHPASSRLVFEGFSSDLGASVGDTVCVIYNPLAQGQEAPLVNTFGDNAGYGVDLCLMYGFNGWNGEDQPPSITPMIPRGDGTFIAHVTIPISARTLDCIVADSTGIGFDTNGGSYYHLHISYVRDYINEGKTVTYRHFEDGSLQAITEEDDHDPQELERMIEEALESRNNDDALNIADEVDDNLVDNVPPKMDVEEMDSLDSSSSPKSKTASTISVENHTQNLRASANAVGEQLGLGNLVINEVREAFDAYLQDLEEQLRPERLGAALGRLGFDELDLSQLDELSTQFCQGKREPKNVTLEEFMKMYHFLDKQDVGISIL